MSLGISKELQFQKQQSIIELTIKLMTNKQEIFCKEYVKLDDASAAYRIAYDTAKMKSATISRNAHELLKNNNVTTRVSELKKIASEIAEKEFKTDSRELLKHLTILRKSRIDQYVDFVDIEVPYFTENENGEREMKVKTERVLQFKPFDQLTEEQLMCVESIKDTRNGIELKLHGKDWTIEKIAKHIGFYEKDNTQKGVLSVPVLTPEKKKLLDDELNSEY